MTISIESQVKSGDKDVYTLGLSPRGKQSMFDLLNNLPVVEDAIIKSGGWITKAAKMLGVTTLQLANVISKSPELLETFTDIKESYLDIAEYQLLKLVRSGELEAIKFWLRCQGKKRGWIDKAQDNYDSREETLIIKIEPAPGISFELTETIKREAEEQIKQIESRVIPNNVIEERINVIKQTERKSLANVLEKQDFENPNSWEVS